MMVKLFDLNKIFGVNKIIEVCIEKRKSAMFQNPHSRPNQNDKRGSSEKIASVL